MMRAAPRPRLRAVAALAAAALALVLALASPARAAPSAADEGFQPVASGQPAAPESLSSPKLVTIAYSAIWLAVSVYLLGLWRRGQRLAHEMEELKRRLDHELRPVEKGAP